MKITPDEKKFIESLSNLSGVSRGDIEKVFSAYIFFVLLDFYEKIENYKEDNILIDEEIVMKIPFVLDEFKIRIKEKEGKGGIGFDTFFSCVVHDYLYQNIHQVIKNQSPDIKEMLKLELFSGLQKIIDGEK